jgi:hypothetical protein
MADPPDSRSEIAKFFYNPLRANIKLATLLFGQLDKLMIDRGATSCFAENQ